MDEVQTAAYSRLKLSEYDDGELAGKRKVLSLAWKKITQTDIRSLYDIIWYIRPGIEMSLDAEELTFLYKNSKEWQGASALVILRFE